MGLVTEGRAGIVVGPDHPGGGVNFHDPLTGNHLQEEGFEINIPDELTKDKRIHLFRGTNSQVINEILKLGGHSLADQVTKVNPGDIIICVRSAWDTRIRTYVGTVEKILDEISTSNGCNPIRRQVAVAKKGGQAAPKGIKQRVKDWQSEDPNSARWKKKKSRMTELANNVQKFRLNVSKDITSDDERTALTALILAVMDRTAERVGNDDSADNGHFGVTGFRKRHINVKGDTVSLHYIGKSGTEHHKTFTDERIAAALKKAIKNSPSQFIFETSDGFRIKSDKVNRYLAPFNISSKNIRGYNANRWIIDILKKEEPKREITGDDSKDKKKRKTIFNKAVKETAKRVGHGAATLKKHYMVPELQSEYMAHGEIIDLKNMGYYSEGGRMGDQSISDYFPNKNEMPDAVKQSIVAIEEKAAEMDKGIYELFTSLPVEVITWENIIPGQDFLRSSKSDRLRAIEDIYSIGLPWVIEYEGKFYILDGHHRILEMHDKKIDIKAHVYHVTSQNNTMHHNGGKTKTTNMKKNTTETKTIGELASEYISNWKEPMPRYLVEYDHGYSTISDYDRAVMYAKAESSASIIDIKTMQTEHYLNGKREMHDGGKAPDEAKKITYPTERLPVIDQSIEERELQLFIENDADLYRQRVVPIHTNLVTKIARGVFDINKAPLIYKYLIDDGIKKYTKDFGGITLTKAEKDNLAKTYVNEFLDEDRYGNYENYLPKKYKAENGGKVPLSELTKKDTIYSTPSNMGGIFRVKYIGLKDGKHQYENVQPGFKGPIYSYTEEEIPENIKKMKDGGVAGEHGAPTCICFSAFVKKEHPELVEKIETTDINESPELRSELDDAYQAYNGGKIK